MKRAVLLSAWLSFAADVAACGFDDGATYALEGNQALHYRLKNPPLLPARHFTMQFQVCRAAAALPVEGFKLDAIMPRHGHGMNYRAEIKTTDRNRVEAAGLLFHMPGLWQIDIDFNAGGTKHRVVLEYRI